MTKTLPFAGRLADLDFQEYEGNPEFIKMVDDINVDGKNTEEYRLAKLSLILRYILNNKDEEQEVIDDKIIKAYCCCEYLLFGSKGERKGDTNSILCVSAKKLGITPETIESFVVSNMEEIKTIAPIIKHLGDLKTEDLVFMDDYA